MKERLYYEGDIFNPELALPGRFDLSFVLVYLTPLFLIVLLFAAPGWVLWREARTPVAGT